MGAETALRVAGRWTTASSATYQGGHDRYSTQAGARARFDFTGREITLVAPKSALRGAARISIDGKFVANVTEYSKTLVSRALLWHHEFTHSGTHYVTVQVLGTKGRPRFDVDGYFVIGPPLGLAAGPSSSARVARGAAASATRGGHPARSRTR